MAVKGAAAHGIDLVRARSGRIGVRPSLDEGRAGRPVKGVPGGAKIRTALARTRKQICHRHRSCFDRDVLTLYCPDVAIIHPE
jgi:hypothetical protein